MPYVHQRVGLALSQYGAFVGRDAVIEVARAAEALGFDSLWTGDRILDPVNPRDRCPGGADGRMPPEYTTFLDPLTVLTAAAAVTERIRLGTSTLNAPWYSPILLARNLTSLDMLTEGRLDVGLGLGGTSDDYTAVGVSRAGRGERLEEIIAVLERVWADDPVTYQSGSVSVPTSRIEPKPVQRPRPPIYLAGFSSVAFERIGRRADGWLAGGVPLQVLTPMWSAIRRAAEDAGRDPDSLRMMLRINPRVTDEPVAADLLPQAGTIEQIAEYARSTGAYEVFADFQQTTGDLNQMLHLAERFREAMA
ncbi:TIGR03619 family F420-dependent LLM class oxidoreductase [Micromonospora azadirachtae]|uniref:TIGR03619 family F420-dependent LLM class oxidoreductase n=1 Tax=Micromonospora azadirachtae TaxID=1970735 RepID=A0ABW3A2M0_9ACTN